MKVIAIDRAAFNQGKNAQYDISLDDSGVAQTLVAKGPGAVAIIREVGGGTPLEYNEIIEYETNVRRLIPLECCRLQGMPDGWCENIGIKNPTEDDIQFWTQVFETYRLATNDSKRPKTRKQIIKWLKEPKTDSAEYQMWGNGMALPNVLFVFEGVRRVLLQRQISQLLEADE